MIAGACEVDLYFVWKMVAVAAFASSLGLVLNLALSCFLYATSTASEPCGVRRAAFPNFPKKGGGVVNSAGWEKVTHSGRSIRLLRE